MLSGLLSSLTPQFFDVLVIVMIVIGLALAALRLYRDFTRDLSEDPRPAPLRSAPPSPPPAADTTNTDDTEPMKPVS